MVLKDQKAEEWLARSSKRAEGSFLKNSLGKFSLLSLRQREVEERGMKTNMQEIHMGLYRGLGMNKDLRVDWETCKREGRRRRGSGRRGTGKRERGGGGGRGLGGGGGSGRGGEGGGGKEGG